jgi:hypothetical protein
MKATDELVIQTDITTAGTPSASKQPWHGLKYNTITTLAPTSRTSK